MSQQKKSWKQSDINEVDEAVASSTWIRDNFSNAKETISFSNGSYSYSSSGIKHMGSSWFNSDSSGTYELLVNNVSIADGTGCESFDCVITVNNSVSLTCTIKAQAVNDEQQYSMTLEAPDGEIISFIKE